MASNPFKSNSTPARRPSVRSPRVNPVPKEPFPRRKLPRVEPLRPPVRRVPTGPLFPGRRLPVKPPFGKRWPVPAKVGAGFRVPWGRILSNPLVIDGALMAGAWLFPTPGYKMPSFMSQCWDFGGPKQKMSGPIRVPAGCSGTDIYKNLTGQVPSGKYGDTITFTSTNLGQTVFFGPATSGGTRMTYTECWSRPDAPSGTYPSPVKVPYLRPLPLEWPDMPPDWWVPRVDPLAPEGPAVAPPVDHRRPYPNGDPLGDPEADPRTEPTTEPYSPPVTRVIDVPSIDIKVDGPSVVITPDVHTRRPPKPREREKKKRLSSHVSYQWLNVLANGIGKYMEVDDVVAAIYKGLPWQVRRWRGRDGVWRDRDPSTATRLKRLYSDLGKLDIETAITEVIKNEMTDQALGRVGSALKKKAGELLPGSIGFQTGGSKIRENWDTVYDRLKKEAAAKKHYEKQKYKRWVSLGMGGGGYLEEKPQGVTEIPWFRKEGRDLTKTGYYGTRKWHDIYYRKT